MAETPIDLSTWPRAAQFHLFRSYDRPHYATTVRLDVSHLMQRAKTPGFSSYRASLYAIGCGLHAAPELLMRFRGDQVVQHDSVALSMSVPRADGGFNYAYVPFIADFAAFDTQAAAEIAATAEASTLGANTGQRDDVAYLSCMPWLDYTSLNNALPGPEDCIPRVSWGKYVDQGGMWDMAMTLEVHHALVDGAHVGAYFQTVQDTLNSL